MSYLVNMRILHQKGVYSIVYANQSQAKASFVNDTQLEKLKTKIYHMIRIQLEGKPTQQQCRTVEVLQQIYSNLGGRGGIQAAAAANDRIIKVV